MRIVIGILMVIVALLVGGPASAQNYTAVLDGLQEVPPVATPAFGSGTFTLNGAKMLSYNITFAGLIGTETGAHIHGPAAVGFPAGIIFPLPAGSPKVGVVGPLTPTQEADLNAGLWYVNVHSTFKTGGEIRGQLLSAVPTETQSWGAIKALYDTE